ncbi:protein aurora borealis-like isoform X2 [Acanthaster planci]|uniref:Protein aurora borealis n=1 Tax=Acanthaster planci TaxID=133434 RepID=A0A8B7Y3X5_ACAPL|nr:protein aurora borealis-like isoform X2 [Acanthaster planci]
MEESSYRSVGNARDTSSCNSTLNPFEADSLDSLHLTQFSPSVFASKRTATPASSKKSSLFRWSIDQLAILHPADIDEHAVQQESTLDSDMEERAQQAIEQFFSQQHVVPSPWSVKRPIKHVTFSPNPPSVSEVNDSMTEAPEGSEYVNDNCLQHSKRSEVSCQTVVTLPVDFDLQAVLGDRFTFDDSQAEGVNDLCSSSLRRKLFSHGEASPTISPVGGGLDDHVSPERIPDIPSPQISPIRQVDDTTLSASDISHVKTPGSAQSQFSSSPISSKLTPRRWTPYSQGSRSSVGLIASPSFSPISSTIYPTTSDSSNPICDSSGKGRAPSCDMSMPEASPILPDASKSQTGMLSPFLASMEPPSVEMMPVLYTIGGNHLRGGAHINHPCVDPRVTGEKCLTSLPPAGKRSGDSHDQSDSTPSDSGDSQTPDLAGQASVCSMEQSCLRMSSESSCDLTADRMRDNDQEMPNGMGGASLSTSKDMLSFIDEYEGTSIPCSDEGHKQLTSTLWLPSHAPCDSLRPQRPLTLKTTPELPQDAVGFQGHIISTRGSNTRSTVAMETAEALPRSKVTPRELVTPMQSDSGFNSQSSTSMEVTDGEGHTEEMQSHEYSVESCSLADKENVCRWKAQVQ